MGRRRWRDTGSATPAVRRRWQDADSGPPRLAPAATRVASVGRMSGPAAYLNEHPWATPWRWPAACAGTHGRVAA